MKALLLAFFMGTSCLFGQEYVRVKDKGDGKYSLIQNGKEFYSIGINAVKIYDGPGMVEGDPVYDQRQQGRENWIEQLKERFNRWGFNTVGPFSDSYLEVEKDLYYTACIYFGNYLPHSSHMLADVFSEEYRTTVDMYAKEECLKRALDKNLIGYFISNEIKIFGEMPWYPHRNPLLEVYLKLSVETPGYKKVTDFLRRNDGKYPYNRLCDIWAAIVMEEYMKVCTESIRRYDSNHLILGTRFASIPPDEVVKAVAQYSDIISFNFYNGDFSLMDRWYALTNKPIAITEFSWRAKENLSNNPNTQGPDVTVNTDNDRANNYINYLNQINKRPYIVLLQWFQLYDEPSRGRSDGYGEDGAYGIISIQNVEYKALTRAMSIANKKWQNKLKRKR